jgi:hypothetical protein
MLAHRPQMNPLPRDEQALGNVDNMRMLIDQQQEQIRYELILQDIAKDGLIYGLGVQKVGWRKVHKQMRSIKPDLLGTGGWVEDQQNACVFDDAWAEWVDPFNFLWDPYGHSVESCKFVIHRSWPDADRIAAEVSAGRWRSMENEPGCDWTLDDLLSSGPTNKIDDINSDRRAADGYDTQRSSHRHELWEFHDGEQVIKLLNGEFPVEVGENPMPDGSLPFQVYRPTRVGGRMVGIGEIEPIEDLQYEINTLRGQRRDAATMALGRGYAFDETAVNADDLQIGPNIAIPINGNPRDFLFPLPIADVPASGYEEETAIQNDIETTSGISDVVTGGDSGGQTATGVQLVQQAASLRIQNKTRRLGLEIIVPGGEAWVLLNQTKILEQRNIPVQDPSSMPGRPAWSMYQLGPAELSGRMGITMDDGSTMAKNVQQMRADAQMKLALRGDPTVDAQKLMVSVLKDLGVEQPEGLLAPQEPQLPASVVDGILGQIDPRIIPLFHQVLEQQLEQQDGAQQGQGQQEPQQPEEAPA